MWSSPNNTRMKPFRGLRKIRLTAKVATKPKAMQMLQLYQRVSRVYSPKGILHINRYKKKVDIDDYIHIVTLVTGRLKLA